MLLIIVKNGKITNFRDFLFTKHWAPLKMILMEIVLYTFILMDLIKKSIKKERYKKNQGNLLPYLFK